MLFDIVRNDITRMEVDAIVNAANTALQAGGGVCGAIFEAAGTDKLQAACNKLAPIKTGNAVLTNGFNLPARFIIHTAGPIYRDGNHGEADLLRASYLNSLALAKKKKCKSVAFPLISTGIYGYPKADALSIAIKAIKDFLAEHDMTVFLVVFDKSTFELSLSCIGHVDAYIDEHYVDVHTDSRSSRILSEHKFHVWDSAELSYTQAPPDMLTPMVSSAVKQSAKLDELVGSLNESFSQFLFRLIDSKGKTDVEVYKKANIDRKHFSKIRSNKHYLPSKRTAIAFAIALELSLEQTKTLLQCAGYALSHSQKFDVIIEYFILNATYDIFQINEVLFHYDQPLLGG